MTWWWPGWGAETRSHLTGVQSPVCWLYICVSYLLKVDEQCKRNLVDPLNSLWMIHPLWSSKITKCKTAFRVEIIINVLYLQGRRSNPGRRWPWRLHFIRWCLTCGSSVWNLLYVTVLAPRILWWLLDFSKNCVFLTYKLLEVTPLSVCATLRSPTLSVLCMGLHSNNTVHYPACTHAGRIFAHPLPHTQTHML